MRAQEPAALSLRAHLRRGRVLTGRPLALAVVLRELPCALLSLGESLHVTRVAPAWVVVEQLLDQVRIELRESTREQFLDAHSR